MRGSVGGDIALGLRTRVGVAAVARAGAVMVRGTAGLVAGAGMLGFVIAVFAFAGTGECQRSCAK